CKNYTVGMTWDITDNFTMDLNYYSIDFEDLIVSEDGQIVLLNDIADGFINDPRITLNPGVTATEVCEVTGRWDPQANVPLPDGCIRATDISFFTLGYINQEYQKQSGIDLRFDYRFAGAGSDWGLQLNRTY